MLPIGMLRAGLGLLTPDLLLSANRQRDSSIPDQTCPIHWDKSALPDLGYKVSFYLFFFSLFLPLLILMERHNSKEDAA